MNKENKKIDIEILNGVITNFSSFGQTNGVISSNHIGLKEITIVIEALKKEQEKIMNRQKDEVQQFNLGTLVLGKLDKIELTNGVMIKPYKNGIAFYQKDGQCIFYNTQIIHVEDSTKD